MGKKSKLVIIFQSVAIVFLLSIIMYVLGWRMFGYTFCMNPNEIESVRVKKTETNFIIYGSAVPWHVTFYNGHIWEIKENTLYIGIKRSLFIPTSGGAQFSIANGNTKVDKIILKNGNHERVIYEKGDELEE